jgi:hypothetical protein
VLLEQKFKVASIAAFDQYLDTLADLELISDFYRHLKASELTLEQKNGLQVEFVKHWLALAKQMKQGISCTDLEAHGYMRSTLGGTLLFSDLSSQFPVMMTHGLTKESIAKDRRLFETRYLTYFINRFCNKNIKK